MKLNFNYPAADYLSYWANCDRAFAETLRYPNDIESPNCVSKIRDCLKEAASEYGVTRTLKREAAGIPRLEPLRVALASIKGTPLTDRDAVSFVTDLVGSLRASYGMNLPSAASKFLWFRFKSPIVIFDQNAYNGLRLLYKGVTTKFFKEDNDWFENYVEAWREKFAKCEGEIRTACEELYQFKRFTAAAEMPDNEIDALVDNQWFRERVFDFYLQYLGEPGSRFEPEVSTQ